MFGNSVCRQAAPGSCEKTNVQYSSPNIVGILNCNTKWERLRCTACVASGHPCVDCSVQLNLKALEGKRRDGLLLEYDAGTLTVKKNGVRLGVALTGVTGKVCWTTTLSGTGATSVRITSVDAAVF
jgi:hypothetical protein